MASPTTPEQAAASERETPSFPIRPRRRRWWRRALLAVAFAGPGLIAANAGNDAGGIATYASAGAQFGYQTLFLMVLITVALVVVQEMCARLGAYTGEGLGALIREQFSLRVTAFALLAFLVANVGLVVSEFAGIAAALELVGVSKYISIPVAAAVIWALVVYGSYRYAEKVFLILSLAFLAYPIAAILARPNLTEAGSLFTGQALIGASVALIPGNLIQLLVQAQVLNGLITPILLTYVLVLANRRSVLGTAANGLIFRVIATACVVVIAIMAVAVLGLTVGGWFGIS
jgi:Mn2+/Fe2+ NRAMP family transporter